MPKSVILLILTTQGAPADTEPWRLKRLKHMTSMMTTSIQETTLQPLELADASISKIEPAIAQSNCKESSESADVQVAMQNPIGATRSSRFFERLITSVIASVGLAVYVATPPIPATSDLSQPNPAIHQSPGSIRQVKVPQFQPEQGTAHLISHSFEVTSTLLDGAYLYGQSQPPVEK